AVIDDTALMEHLDQALYQRVIAISSFRMTQQKLQRLLQSFGQTSQRILEHRHALEQMLFMWSRRGHLNANRRRLHDDHQTRTAAQAELLTQRIRRTALLTIMRNCSSMHSLKDVLCTLFFIL